ncbi:MAG TPA: hypothetical protein VGL86_21175 [Polyangia bacterium]|jgi:hypothetical protein
MMRSRTFLVLPLILAAACQAAPTVDDAVVQATITSAGIDLVAIGRLPGTVADRSRATAAPLENGVAGNLLGGVGSGIAYAGWGTFIAIPDRGPNAVVYDAAIDDTASYINRFQTIRMQPGAEPRRRRVAVFAHAHARGHDAALQPRAAHLRLG